MKCSYCGTDATGSKHINACPYNPANILKITLFLKNYLLTTSKFNKQFKPYPSHKELDKFLPRNKIMRLKTIRRRYFEHGIKLEEWLLEILSISKTCAIIKDSEFPYYLLYIYDSWLFMSKEEYKKSYELAIAFEEGDSLLSEVSNIALEVPSDLKPFDLNELDSYKL